MRSCRTPAAVRHTIALLLLLTTLPASLAAQHRDPEAGPVDEAVVQELVAGLWEAETPRDRELAVRALIASGAGTTALGSLLRAGRVYGPDPATGLLEHQWVHEDGTVFPYLLWIPESYDPARRYPVRVYLHGGVSRGPWEPGERWWRNTDRVRSEQHIALIPAAWSEARWWHRSQVESLREILRRVRTVYNTDENRVSMIGISDGGTGAYFFAFRDTTPWASFLPFIAHPAVLLNPSVGADGAMYLHNLTNKPLFIVNGTEDRLYPTRVVEPFLAEFADAGVDVVYRPQEGGGHDTRWWPGEAERIDRFIRDRPRKPHPARVSWEVEQGSPYTRAHWVRIDELGPTQGDRRFAPSLLLDAGLFSGRIDAEREGNTIRIESAGVRRFTVLLSEDALDLDRPVQVVWNGSVVFHAGVRRDAAVLARWAAEDDDRTMLYQAELTIDWRTR